MATGLTGQNEKLDAVSEEDRDRFVDMHTLQGVSYKQIATVWNRQNDGGPVRITERDVSKIVRERLTGEAEYSRGATDALREKHNRALDQALRVAWQVALGAKCTVCDGNKTVAVDRLDPSLGQQVCPKCDGSGRNEDDSVRLSALTTIKGLLERHAKLFGLDAPVEVRQTTAHKIALDVASIKTEALGDELDGFFRAADLEGTATELPLAEIAPGLQEVPIDLPEDENGLSRHQNGAGLSTPGADPDPPQGPEPTPPAVEPDVADPPSDDQLDD